VDDAWDAARAAGLAADIEAMPMGMYTLVGEGVSTLSGGQRQRVLIARALVGKPRILLLDEATSALDSLSQSAVQESLARLDATRVVIAHRLATVRDADRIVVLERGRIVQQGTFRELATVPGPFAAMLARQEA
jgi:ABC-type bacteriocin/lantibiotic exporter with double-glycine peptidase domain